VRDVQFGIDSIELTSTTVEQIIRYLVIGALTALVDFATLYLLAVCRHWNTALAAAIAFLVALIIHFTLNKYYNFKSFDRSVRAQLRTYIAVTVVNFLSTIIFIHLFTNYVGIPILWSKAMTVLINMSWGFPAQKFLTFGRGIRASSYLFWQGISRRS
jgi:putative flippase GtrA